MNKRSPREEILILTSFSGIPLRQVAGTGE